MSPNGNAQLITADEVADLLAVPKTWVYAETRAGRLPHVRLGRYRRYRADEIDAWIAELARGPEARRRRSPDQVPDVSGPKDRTGA
jgi:excisionase family DNA binding protein